MANYSTYDGIVGYQGYQGPPGATGPQGPQGEIGERGFQGQPGLKGDQGYQGSQGYQGPQGYQGNPANQGWTADGTRIYVTDYITPDFVGIGTNNPTSSLVLGYKNNSAQTTATYGIDFGGDVNLYRSAANVLKTDDNLIISNEYVQVGSGTARLRACTIDAAGNITSTSSGNDMMLNADADSSPTGEFVAEKVWNAVYNDFADFQQLAQDEIIVYGKCYFDTKDGAKICTKRCQKSVIGIASNTFGFAAGANNNIKQIPIAVSGWTLAYVDKSYEPGTPLTNDEFGNLTEMTETEKILFPERLLAIYKKKENKEYWGTENKKIFVDNRHWVKIF